MVGPLALYAPLFKKDLQIDHDLLYRSTLKTFAQKEIHVAFVFPCPVTLSYFACKNRLL